jgi:ribosome biogenesis protein BMS1
MSEDLGQKKHQPRQAGRKKEKKKAKNAQPPTKKDRSNNPKAFAFNSGIKAAKMGQRAQEFIEKKLHVPLQDRTGAEPAPTVVAVVGPSGAGKSTLIRSLVKRYTKQNLSQIKGPITVVAGKGKRLTFLECNNDLNSMLDVAKIADLVLLLVDASFGFEMETFEFLNVLQSHGFPKVVGVLTHLDSFRESKRLNSTKKTLKKRFWTEICDGAKVFYLSGIMNSAGNTQGARYPVNEVLNISRYLNTCKIRPLIWRNSHPYILADRIEDMTNPVDISTNPKCDRKVIFYGYARGIPLKPHNTSVHIPGVGDFRVKEITSLPDPCPFPEAVKKRTLNYKERLIYAPMSDVAGILYDKDAVYITTPSAQANRSGDAFEKQVAMEELGVAIEQHAGENVSLLAGGETLRVRRAVVFDQELSEAGSDDSDDEQEQEQEQEEKQSEEEEEYDIEQQEEDAQSDSNNDSEDEFLKPKTTLRSNATFSDYASEEDVSLDPEVLHSKFIGYEEPLEDPNPTHNPTLEETLESKKEALKRRFDAEYDGESDEENPSAMPEDSNYYTALKQSMKAQQEMNLQEFSQDDPTLKEAVQGIQPGTYVRCLIEAVPCEFIRHFNPYYPVLLGGLLANEMNFGYLQARLKAHRWHGRILKSNEPLVFSVGWRRFQSIPLFSLKDATRNRLLKYTPAHMHCMATFYGPIVPPNSGLLAFRSLDPALCGKEQLAGFRVAATGVILEIDQSVQIVKKLKLVGHPFEVHKNTAFIKDMFNSALEVAKFEGASIRTVSGLRGSIKKAVKEPEGAFRASFEDKILPSDIVFLKTWFPLTPRRYYNPLCTLLLENKQQWIGMRSNVQVRSLLGSEASTPTSNVDSQYRPVERKPRLFKPLQIPRTLERELPFASKPKVLQAGKPVKRAVVLEPEEKKIVTLVQQLATVKREQDLKREAKRSLDRIAYHKRLAAEEARLAEKHAKKRKKIYLKEEEKRKQSDIRARK